VSFDFRSSPANLTHNDANFGIGTLGGNIHDKAPGWGLKAWP
jgi:hypothetical protein